MPELIKARREAFRALMHEVDVVVALREWVRKVLLQNQVPGSKIVLCEHGMTRVSQNSELLIEVTSKPLRIAFLGRADKVKGVDTLIKAVRELPGRAVELHLYGVMQSATDREYWTDLESLVAGDARIKFLPPVPQTEVVSLLRSYHLLAVPSRWLETGPLVILESFSAGTPVIGSNLGGIAEWIIPGKNGLLVDCDDIAGWADTLKRCSENRHLLATLREGVEQPRRMREVAQEMSEMYHRYSTSDAYRHRSGQPAERSNA